MCCFCDSLFDWHRKKGKSKRRDDDDDDEESTLTRETDAQFASQDEIANVLKKHIVDGDDKFLQAVAAHMIRPLNQKFQVLHCVCGVRVITFRVS